MRKYNVFIGSSSENIEFAEAIQVALYNIPNLLAQCWNQGIFSVGNYILEDLFEALRCADFAVFILTPDDYIISRDREYYSARDNVVFELGMFMGFLGRKRTFFIIPKNDDIPYKVPSDLLGINYATYNTLSIPESIDAALGPACTQIKKRIASLINTPIVQMQIEEFGLFPDFDARYNVLFDESKEITTIFLHSRRWRENNLESIKRFFGKDKSVWNVILPDITNQLLLSHITEHFLDGLTLKEKIRDAYQFYLQYMRTYPNKVRIFSHSLYPTYTAYRFDKKMIVSMYPLTNDRRPTPTFMMNCQSQSAVFFHQDLDDILLKNKHLEISEIEKLLLA